MTSGFDGFNTVVFNPFRTFLSSPSLIFPLLSIFSCHISHFPLFGGTRKDPTATDPSKTEHKNLLLHKKSTKNRVPHTSIPQTEPCRTACCESCLSSTCLLLLPMDMSQHERRQGNPPPPPCEGLNLIPQDASSTTSWPKFARRCPQNSVFRIHVWRLLALDQLAKALCAKVLKASMIKHLCRYLVDARVS